MTADGTPKHFIALPTKKSSTEKEQEGREMVVAASTKEIGKKGQLTREKILTWVDVC